MSSLLRGKLSIKPALISWSINRCFSSLQKSPSPWLMVPPTLLGKPEKDINKKCPNCKTALIRCVDPTLNIRRNSEVKPDDNNYYHFLNVADNKLSFKKKKKNLVCFPSNNNDDDNFEPRCIGSSHGWLAFIHPHNCALYLYNPFNDSYIPLPLVETMPCIVSLKRLFGNLESVFEIVYDPYNENEEMTAEDLSKMLFKKVVMSGAPSDECIVMGIYHEFPNTIKEDPRKLAFCIIGDSSWTELDSPSRNYSDIVYLSKDKCFYAALADSTGYCDEDWLECWDLSDPSSPIRYVCEDSPVGGCGRTKVFHLVEYSGELLVVVRYYDSRGKYETKAFDLYKLTRRESKFDWEYVPSIGDHILFVGGYQSVCLSAHDFPGLRKNCIYFTAHDYDFNESTELGVYNLEDERLEESVELERREHSPVWVFPHD